MSSSKNCDIAQLLLKHGARLDLFTKGDRQTPLHKAILSGDEEITLLLLNQKETILPVNALDNTRSSPLHYALRFEHVSLEASLQIVQQGGNLYGKLSLSQ